MTDKHPITPPRELVQQWWQATLPNIEINVKDQLCTQAARWGADQELEAILEMVGFGQQSLPEEDRYLDGFTVASLRAARRPKPLSEADVALADLDALVAYLSNHGMGFKTTNLRCALERLKELEAYKQGVKGQVLEALAAIEGDFNTVEDRAETIRRVLGLLPNG